MSRQLHSENDLPAIQFANGDKVWYKNGEIHRDNDLPAIEFANGEKWWCIDGKLWRKNGLPYIVYADEDPTLLRAMASFKL